MTLVTGNQLKAARALAGVDQHQVAEAAGVNVNTIRNMEARGADPITSGAVTVRNVQLALESLGIEFLNHTQPGVRLSPGGRAAQAASGKLPARREQTSKKRR
jgi:transcriptional regulator with XRE-family HTH domain